MEVNRGTEQRIQGEEEFSQRGDYKWLDSDLWLNELISEQLQQDFILWGLNNVIFMKSAWQKVWPEQMEVHRFGVFF